MSDNSFTVLIAEALMVLVPMILSLTVHEFSHAAAAKWLGDDTAEGMNRLNLNPINHADLVGTIILPLAILLVSGGLGAAGRFIPFFGWAKPVPVNPARFSRKVSASTGMMLVAAAGPASNLLLAILCAGGLSALYHTGAIMSVSPPLIELLRTMFIINIALCVFNMIPLYPLDGQKVVAGFLRGDTAIKFERFNVQFGTMGLMAIIFFGRGLLTAPIYFVADGVRMLVGLA